MILEASGPKCVNSNYTQYGVNSKASIMFRFESLEHFSKRVNEKLYIIFYHNKYELTLLNLNNIIINSIY